MKNSIKSQINKIYSKLNQKYKVGPRKLEFEDCTKEDILNQMSDVLKKIHQTATKELEEYQESSSVDTESTISNQIEFSESLSDPSVSESNEYVEDDSDDESDNSSTNEDILDADTQFLSAKDALKELEKSVENEFEIDDQLESDYSDNLQN